MARHQIVVDKLCDWLPDHPNRTYLSLADYLHPPVPGAAPTPGSTPTAKHGRVINLCSDYSYLGSGYYVSLLAEARSQRALPSVQVLLDLYYRRLYKATLTPLNRVLAKTFKEPATLGETHRFAIYFGWSTEPQFAQLSRRIFDRFRCPLLTVELEVGVRGWGISTIKPLSLKDLPEPERPAVAQALDRYTHAVWRSPKIAKPPRYTIAILHNPKEKMPPSDGGALRKFESVGQSMGLGISFITRKDLPRLGEYDALFIRETTSIDHHTFRFARKAADEGIPVIDDPLSIMRCTNKVYLAELLQAHQVPALPTTIITRSTIKRDAAKMAYPAVLKIPDGCFSRGVHKVVDEAACIAVAKKLLDESDLILAQPFRPTPHDWRIGILKRQPLYACKYFMARNHWQIVKHEDNGKSVGGRASTVPLDQVPPAVMAAALKAANLIGDSLYGVDVKETEDGQVFVIEVNDNPSIDSGVEDLILKDGLYRAILSELVSRIEAQ